MTQTEEQASVIEVPLRCDGHSQVVEVPAQEALLETLRERLGITSVRGTCGIGVCGTCTVLMDGKPVSSCITLTVQSGHHEITTAAGLPKTAEGLAPVQQAFVERGAYQCSFCIPAMTLAVHAALADPEVDHTVEAVRERLSGNLCRCGTYPQILQAVMDLLTPTETEESGDTGR